MIYSHLRNLVGFGIVSFIAIIFAAIGTVSASAFDPLAQVCSQDGASNSVACTENATAQGQNGENPVTSTTENVVNVVSFIGAVMAVIVIIIAGITTTLSQGDSGKIKTSRDAIIYSAVGLVVIALSRTIIIFILNRTA